MSMEPPSQPPAGPPPGGQSPGGPPQMPYAAQPGPDEVTSNDRLWAALSYVFSPIIPIVVLLMDDTKNRRFTKYHAVQALALGIVFYLIAFILNIILSAILFNTATIGAWGMISCVLSLIWLIPLAIAIYCAVQAYNGKYFTIPVLTDFLAGQKWLQKPNV